MFNWLNYFYCSDNLIILLHPIIWWLLHWLQSLTMGGMLY